MLRKWAAIGAAAITIVGVFTASGGAAVADRVETKTAPTDRSAVGPAALVRGFAWTVNDDYYAPIGTVYSPSPWWDHSSAHAGETASEFIHIADGTYRATLYGVNGEGIPHVSARSAQVKCKINGWGPRVGRPDENVSVKCYGGWDPHDVEFSVSFTNQRSTTYPNARLYYNGSSVPSAHSFNSKGGANTVSRGSTGVYRVLLGKLGSQGGHVQVTAAGGSANWCKVSSWGSSTPDQVVTVRCFTPAAEPVNTAFVLSYVHGGNILGAPNVQAGKGVRSVYATIDPAAAPTVNAARRYSSPAGTNWSVARLPWGNVRVTLPIAVHDNDGFGQVQVTALGASTTHCGPWTLLGQHGNTVDVECYSATGHKVFAPFTISVIHRQLR